MAISETSKVQPGSLAPAMWRTVRSYVSGRRALVIVAAAAVSGGIALNWGWLVAAGIAPVLLSVLPCAVMCGHGLCAHKMMGGSRAAQSNQTPAPSDTRSKPELAADSPNHHDFDSGEMHAQAQADHYARCCRSDIGHRRNGNQTSIQNEYWFDVINLVRQELSDTHLTLPSRVNSVACSLTKSYMLIVACKP
jgi:hypothetical protein